MTHRFTRAAGALLVVDVQERLAAAMPAERLERLINRTRATLDYETGLALCREAGAKVTTVEAVLFDALGKAGGPEFKAISAAVK